MAELESSLEGRLIKALTQGTSQWTFCPELTTEDALWQNLRNILEMNNRDKLKGVPLSDREFEQVKNQLSFPSFYAAAEWIVGENGKAHVHVQRGNEVLHLLVLNRAHVTGGTSVYQVIHQVRRFKDEEHKGSSRARRFDVTLLINGLPLIHLELKNREHPYKDGFRQIQKYIKEGQFTGIFSTVQMFVVSNDVDTKYIASARYDEMNARFLSGWVDKENKAVPGLFEFAKDVLSIPEAHEMITQYSVLDKEKQRIILLRPYQIHAIEAIREASKRNQSGFIWHTTGSGKTLTSYKVARNLLMDIPAIEKTIFLIDRKDLDQQTTTAFQSYAENDTVDVDETENTGDLIKKLQNQDRQMIVTTIQKLQILVKRLRTKPNSPAYRRISQLRLAFVVDECHRAVSPQTKRMLEAFFFRGLWYGFTGTPRFKENAYDELGDMPRTTEELYGPCLHSYTVKEAIHDGAVLGFQVEHLGPKDLQTDEEGNNINEDMSVYGKERHMLQVLDVLLNQTYEKLGISHGGGRTYEGMLTVSSIAMAQAYYKLLKRVKNGETSLQIREDVRRILPDFPKFAITYSVTENEDGSMVNQSEMEESLSDYNAMFGTHFGLDQIGAYNTNLNDRLARKEKKFLARMEQLDLVIVVDRLLTGFDAPCLSTLFIDRQPMKLHSIIQAFSRTNRIFDGDKTYGQILTFQSPGTFKNKVDDALRLFSQGGENAVLAPDFTTAEFRFIAALAEMRAEAPDPDLIATMSRREKVRFAAFFQHYDSAFRELRAFTDFQKKDLKADYHWSFPQHETYRAHYLNVLEELKPGDDGDDPPIDPVDPKVDMEYELAQYGQEIIDYEYIVALIQQFVADTTLKMDTERYEKQKAEIAGYLSDIEKANPKFGALLLELWEDTLHDPLKYKDKDLISILERTRKERRDEILKALCRKWCIDENSLRYAMQQYDGESGQIPFMNRIKETADYPTYVEKHGGQLKKFQYRKALEKDVKRAFDEDIIPLQGGKIHSFTGTDDHQILAAEDADPYGTK